MDFSLTEEQRMLKESTRAFMASKEVQQWIKEARETKKFTRDFMRAAAGLGYLGMNVDEKYGGAGMNYLDAVIALEEIAYASITCSLNILVQNSLFNFAVETFGREDQKEKHLPLAVRGDLFGCFANTEPEAGSDAKNIVSRAERRNGKWILNGRKQFITNASVAGAAVISCRTAKRKQGNPGITTFLIDIGDGVSGYELTKIEKKVGQHGSELCEFTLTNYEATDENVLGEVNHGWDVVDRTFRHSRVWIAAQGVGGARRALDEMLKHTSERQTFGGPLIDKQYIAFDFAKLSVDIESALLLTHKAACLEMQNNPAFGKFASMAKYLAAETATRAADRCCQYHGGMSIIQDVIAANLWFDLFILRVYEGASEIQLAIIAKALKESVRVN
jgi:alkylation response protein AidB-like acyl-CoA dehydrogenase